jgi:hydroxymethylpyrimidine/phosphomethylpyrimidine kinase
MTATPPKLLSIAGSDPSGGAGIQADLKTFAALGAYGMAAITALTVQNTQGVMRVAPVPVGVIDAQIDAIFADIAVDAVKIGMLATAKAARVVAASLQKAQARKIVLDPVLAASLAADEASFSEADLAPAILQSLLPFVDLATPNLAEAATLTGTPVARNVAEMAEQAERLVAWGAKAALVTGGHLEGAPTDVLFAEGAVTTFPGARIETRNAHGSGCALSSAIAAGLAKGQSLEDAIRAAKAWLERALAAGAAFSIGAGAGPPDHFWAWRA